MSIDDADLLRLKHMRDYAREVVDFTQQAERADLDSDLKLERAMTYSTGIIGEAASHLSQDFRDAHPEIPWGSIIGMRNFLFHEYFHIESDILWKVATEDIPDLLEKLQAILSE